MGSIQAQTGHGLSLAVPIVMRAPANARCAHSYSGNPAAPCFVADAEHLLDGGRARLWVHGHTHDSFEYVVNGTRVVCNPRGYANGGANENPLFDPDFQVEIK